jgi:hypothetical protein
MSEAVTRRHRRPGDIGWAISRHGALHAAQFGWTIAFEALVAHIAARIAEHAGERLGSVFLVQARDDDTETPLPARGIYAAAGCRLKASEPHCSLRRGTCLRIPEAGAVAENLPQANSCRTDGVDSARASPPSSTQPPSVSSSASPCAA